MADWTSDDTDIETDSSTPSFSLKDVPAANYTNMFDSNQPLILELHELEKDEPASGTTTNPDATTTVNDTKAKKKKKKNRLFGRDTKEVVSPASESSTETAVDLASKEEFYDARESYHGIESAPQVQVVGSHITPPVLTNSLGSPAVSHQNANVMDALKITGSAAHQTEPSQAEPGSQATIQKPTAPPP